MFPGIDRQTICGTEQYDFIPNLDVRNSGYINFRHDVENDEDLGGRGIESTSSRSMNRRRRSFSETRQLSSSQSIGQSRSAWS